jgi:hypothetical protein
MKGSPNYPYGVEDAAWVPPVLGVTVTLRQPGTMPTWTVFQHDDVAEHDPHTDTIAVRAARMGGYVGLNEGLLVTDGRVKVLKLWLRLYPGDMHADLRNLNVACLSNRGDFRQVNPTEFVKFWSLMVAGIVYGQRGRYLCENSNMLDEIRDHPQFQKYKAFHKFKRIRFVTKYCKEEIQKIGLDPWAWFRNGVDDLNINRRDVLHHGLDPAKKSRIRTHESE